MVSLQFVDEELSMIVKNVKINKVVFVEKYTPKEWLHLVEECHQSCWEGRKKFVCVTTLALGSRLRQGLAKVHAKREARESHFMLPGMWESVREWTFTLPSELSLWELESQIF